MLGEQRLGDIIDDFCVKCRRLTNHAIVSLVETQAAKVRCRTCYHDHDYRHEQAPPSKKELKKAEEAAAAALAAMNQSSDGVLAADCALPMSGAAPTDGIVSNDEIVPSGGLSADEVLASSAKTSAAGNG